MGEGCQDEWKGGRDGGAVRPAQVPPAAQGMLCYYLKSEHVCFPPKYLPNLPPLGLPVAAGRAGMAGSQQVGTLRHFLKTLSSSYSSPF